MSTANGARAALDILLTDAALAPSDARRLVQPGAALGVVAGLARRPRLVTRRTAGLGAELARVVAGRSERAPAREDSRLPLGKRQAASLPLGSAASTRRVG